MKAKKHVLKGLTALLATTIFAGTVFAAAPQATHVEQASQPKAVQKIANQKVRLTVLTDDTVASDKFVAEHGLSVLIELPNGHRWLLDTGTTNVYLENAQRLGISLEGLNGLLISHNHEDHTGGLVFYDRLKTNPPVYGHPLIWHKSYQFKEGKAPRVLSIPYEGRVKVAPHFKPVNNTTQLDEGLYFLTDIPHKPGVFAPTKGNYFNEDKTGPDPLIDDGSVAIKTASGLVVILGCGHAGYNNILEEVHRQFPNEKIAAVLGGAHLLKADDKVLGEALKLTKELKSDDFVYYGGHCTGDNTLNYFKKGLGADNVRPLGSGRILEFDI